MLVNYFKPGQQVNTQAFLWGLNSYISRSTDQALCEPGAHAPAQVRVDMGVCSAWLDEQVEDQKAVLASSSRAVEEDAAAMVARMAASLNDPEASLPDTMAAIEAMAEDVADMEVRE